MQIMVAICLKSENEIQLGYQCSSGSEKVKAVIDEIFPPTHRKKFLKT